MDVITFVQWVGVFRFGNCAIYLYRKTKVEITKHPFCVQGVGGCSFYTKVIQSRNRMRTHEIVPYMVKLFLGSKALSLTLCHHLSTLSNTTVYFVRLEHFSV